MTDIYTTLDFQARNIQFLEFELNNQCQLAGAHPWCPRNRLCSAPYVEIDTAAIHKVIDFFAGYDFSGTVYFSIYNEPLLDPRIVDLIRYARRAMPGCTVQMYSNGIALTPDLAQQLADAGLNMFRLSLYAETASLKISESLAVLQASGVYVAPIERNGPEFYSAHGWDDRIGIYDRDAGCRAPCYMPIQYLCFNCRGEALLCWDDWKATKTFGNLATDTVESILMHPDRINKIEALKQGVRWDVCVGCSRPTELCISEYRSRLKL